MFTFTHINIKESTRYRLQPTRENHWPPLFHWSVRMDARGCQHHSRQNNAAGNTTVQKDERLVPL